MKPKKRKYVFVVGGVMSGVGKGVAAASIGAIMKAKGFTVTAIKADPYINTDAGTMNPTEHGEVYVTDDGDETDQDMGNYERFLDTELSSLNYMTTGRIYLSVIEKERAMKYKGKCVQVVPHIPLEIISRIKTASEEKDADITIVEIGGTVGEYENILFLEAVRLMKLKNPKNVAVVLVSYMPVPSHIGEMKTKPTQYASRALNSAGLNVDFILARGPRPLDEPRREKLAVFCGIPKKHCISAPDIKSIYEVPINFEKENFGNKLLTVLDLRKRGANLTSWNKLFKKINSNTLKPIKIAVVGKYFETGSFTLSDSYISVIEALKHASWSNNACVTLEWVDAEQFEKDPKLVNKLKEFSGIVVPGGFGSRGVEGIINAICFAREQKIPYLGLCYGMQLAAIEFARNVLGLKDANTVEINPNTTNPIIVVNDLQVKNIRENKYGGTMRLGAYDCELKLNSKAREAYKQDKISERHRHRYEFNNKYRESIDNAGLRVVGVNPESNLVEILELDEHPFFVGVQFHPEFKSRPMRPHPLFREFISATLTK